MVDVGRMRPFTGLIWVDDSPHTVRFTIQARSREDTVALLVKTYGDGHTFHVVDVEAAARIR